MSRERSSERRSGAGDRRRPGPRDPAAARGAPVWLYGLHTVAAALANPRRRIHRFVASRNALARLDGAARADAPAPEILDTRAIGRLLPEGAVHQGVGLLVDPLAPQASDALAGARLVLLLDQVTDPHNVGAILRSAAAFAVDAVVTTSRHSPQETGVLAKAASGALDRIDHVEVTNLARTLDALGAAGFLRIALDSAGETALERVAVAERIALVLGAEGKGVRPGVRAACDATARLDVPGAIASLNVSNAAAVALYVARTRLAGGEG